MEALAALGLASNIISFVDFAYKLLGGTIEIYSSGAGVADGVVFLDRITQDVQLHAERVVAVENAAPDLQDLARQCDEIAQELLQSLKKLRVNGDKTRWNSFLVALQSVRFKAKVKELTDKLSQVQARISAHLVELLVYVPSFSRSAFSTNYFYLAGKETMSLAWVAIYENCRPRTRASALQLGTKFLFLRKDVQEVIQKLTDGNSRAILNEYFDQDQ